jgi:ribosomal protein L11 methyltransferase
MVHLSAIFDDNTAALPYIAIAELAEELEESVWKYRWLEDFHGYALNREVFIYPVTSSIPLATEYPITIYLDPRDAFGDGRHPTTFLCLEMLYDMLRHRMGGSLAAQSMLDVGTGTGILCILAARLGLQDINAVDVDKTSVEMAGKNFELNDCGFIRLKQCGIEDFSASETFGIVTANLLSGIITDNIDRLIALMKPDGALLVSGISTRWEAEMEELFTHKRLAVEEKRKLEDWLAYRLKINNSP